MHIYAFYLYFLQSVPALAPLSVSPPLRASRQLSRKESQVTIVNSGKVGGQAKEQESLPHHKFLSVYGRNLAPPAGLRS